MFHVGPATCITNWTCYTDVRWQQPVHEQSYYIVHYIRRKEEGKEGREKRTNTNNLQQPQRLTYVYLYMYSISQLGMQMHCALWPVSSTCTWAGLWRNGHLHVHAGRVRNVWGAWVPDITVGGPGTVGWSV